MEGVILTDIEHIDKSWCHVVYVDQRLVFSLVRSEHSNFFQANSLASPADYIQMIEEPPEVTPTAISYSSPSILIHSLPSELL